MSYYYIDLSLEFQPDNTQSVSTVAFFKKHVVTCIRKTFGETGASATIDILKFNPEETRAIIRVSSEYYVKLRSALSLCGDYEGKACAYRIHKTSDLLISLCGDSRTYKH